ncbi:glutamyl-tRNA reductase [Salsuginibacillus halophilus]|uniref:Glutamyl-tRNA reductase n=1 Tax=Salsuginibacillus halophilus TaxID=517424 RepID=A0A2P8HCP1_9BACI|nr:glutamyl-tRNA reductase [Salsuginibacillus halophilus]PSL44000.1 glutamyl-tRNA reductase [Salsuginibacillus halophilus]
MHIIVAGLDYKKAPVALRENFAFDEGDQSRALHTLRQMKSVLECTIISTCNRTEIYAVVDQLHTGRHFTKKFLSEWFDEPVSYFESSLAIRENDEAVRHLLRVASGLDSMVLGETQILGQVKEAFQRAQEEGATGTIFNELFKQAITFAKRAHSETAINDNAVSVSYAAVELGKTILGSFQDKHVAVLGAGKMSELTAKHLQSSGAAKISVLNRTYDRAAELAERFLGEAKSMDKLSDTLQQADILISSTGADAYVIDETTMAQAKKKRKGRPLFMVDIAVPRDLDPALGQLDDVYLYDIDDLQGIVEQNLEERKKEAVKIEEMIEVELNVFKDWVQTLGVVPVISALRSKALSIQAETMESIERKLPDLSDREKKVLQKHTKSIVNQMLREPITRAKEIAATEDAAESLAFFTEVFGLEEEVETAKMAEAAKLKADAIEQEEKLNELKEAKQPNQKGAVWLPYAYAKDVAIRS